MFNYILFDLDNTIYNYDKSHEISLEIVINEISKEFNISETELTNNYIIEKKKFQNYCNNASSHNKFIQIKRLFEKYNLNLERLNYYHDLYNKNFIENLVLYPFLLDFLKFCKSKNIKMYILTNNISSDQIRRLNSKGISNYFEKVYTSEEFGIEKPDMKLYYYVIQDIGCNKNEIVKIGDNYKNDIEPMIINNLYAFWFNNNDFNIKDKYLEFNNYKDLNLFFEKYYNSLIDYLEISNYVGERFDLVQAGGGNTSFKTENLMFVKSSGSCLSNLDINKNYVGLNYSNIKNKINDKFFMKDGLNDDIKTMIGCSLLGCDLSKMKLESERAINAGIDFLHIDVMDGHFVPNLSWGPPVIKDLRKNIENAFFDVHLMVDNPEQWVDQMAESGADSFTFHIESTNDPDSLINLIRSVKRKMKVGIALKPNTSVNEIIPYLNKCDLILVMTVEPGFGGQKFMNETLSKIKFLRDNYPQKIIEVDGGINTNTVIDVAKAGANMIVSGSAIFKSSNISKTIELMRDSVNKYNIMNSNNKFNLVTNLNKKEREVECKKIVDSNIVFLKNFKPSIETSLHCYTHKFCVHIHPIQFNYISSLPTCDDIINSIFDNFIIIDYVTPGIDVTLELVKKYNGEKIIFMKNHGLVITSDSVIELKNILDNTIEKLETYSNLNFNLYKIVNKISKEMNMITNEKTITYMSENIFINNYINSNSLDKIFRPYFPDKVVYCGTSYLIFTLDTISQDIKEYINNYDEIPKVFILKNEEKYLLYINSKSINKCKEIEEVLLSHFICYNELNIFLDKSEINYLNNWDAEKFRKNLQ